MTTFNLERFTQQREALLTAFVRFRAANTTRATSTARSEITYGIAVMVNAFPSAEHLQERAMRAWNRYMERNEGKEFDIEQCANDNCRGHYSSAFMLEDEESGDRYCPACASRGYDRDYRLRTCMINDPEPEYDENSDGSFDSDDLRSYDSSPIHVLRKEYVLAPGETYEKNSIKLNQWGDREYRGTRLFGFEIEFVVDPADTLGQMMNEEPSTAILKSDGSLPHGGAELCTLPFSKKGAVIELEKISAWLLGHGARAWNRHSCGLHIHVARNSASWLTWGKVDRFFQNKSNRKFLDLVGGRSPNDFCRREGFDNLKEHKVKAAYDKTRYGSDRYEALNFSTNKPTVEFRLFRGNVSYDGLIRCMEFCDSLIEFARDSSNQSEMNAFDYVVWLQNHAAAYPRIVKYIRKGEVSNGRDIAA